MTTFKLRFGWPNNHEQVQCATSFNFCLTARQMENSKEFCFLVLMQYTSKFVFRASAQSI